MKLKLTNSEMQSLSEMVKLVVDKWPRSCISDLLLHTMMTRLSIELQQRVILLQKEYKLSWHPERAMAFFIVFCDADFPNHPFENNLRMRIVNQIHQQFPCS